jgi:hypothetical protein
MLAVSTRDDHRFEHALSPPPALARRVTKFHSRIFDEGTEGSDSSMNLASIIAPMPRYALSDYRLALERNDG